MKTYANSAWRCTFSGDLFNGVEDWASALWIGNPGSDAPAPDMASAVAIAGRWVTFFTSGMIGSWARTSKVTLSHILANGDTVNNDTVIYNVSPIAVGGYGGIASPGQLSYCFEMRSSLWGRGVGSHGRMFLPGTHPDTDGGTGRMAAATVTNYSTNLKTMLEGINTDLAAKSLVVINNGAQHTTKSGVVNAARAGRVDSIQCPDVVDTQRRRIKNIRPNYTAAVI